MPADDTAMNQYVPCSWGILSTSLADPNVFYVWDITFDSRQRGPHTDYQVVVDMRQDSNGIAESTDPGLAGVAVTVIFTDTLGNSQLLTGLTDANGIFRSN